MANSANIIAATFSTDGASIREYRYQSTRTRRAVYAVSDQYFCVCARKPNEMGLAWREHADQFFAQREGTTLWVADMNADAEQN
jgi:hypothetical protein